MRVVIAVAVVTALIGIMGSAVPARAQTGGSQGPHLNLLSDSPSKTQEEKEQDAERDRKYKDSLRKIPDAKAPNDPWGSVRSDAPKSATTKAPATAKAKAKSPSAQN
jgi:hypothetical protein